MAYDTIYDVIVCGAGTSGIAAAIGAARTGAKTLLVERTGTMGGQMSLSGPPGFAYARLFNPQGKRDIGGIVEETYQRLFRTGHALPHLRYPVREKAGYSFSYVDPEWWTMLMFEMMDEEGVELLLDTLVVGVTKDGGAVTGITVENANGRNEIRGKIVIDCTGEGYVAAQAGCQMDCVSREDIQPHTLAFTVDGVDWDTLLTYIREHPEQFSYRQLIFPYENANTQEDVMEMYRKCHDITELGELMGFYQLRDMAFKNGDWHPYSGAGFFLTPREGGHIQAHFQHSSQVDHALPTDAWDLTRCMVECRKQNLIAWRFFKNYVPGFKNAYITKVCTELRLREGPRIVGDYILTRDDVAECRQFADTIGKSSFKAGAYHVSSMDTLNACVTYPHHPRRRGHHGGGGQAGETDCCGPPAGPVRRACGRPPAGADGTLPRAEAGLCLPGDGGAGRGPAVGPGPSARAVLLKYGGVFGVFGRFSQLAVSTEVSHENIGNRPQRDGLPGRDGCGHPKHPGGRGAQPGV